MNSKNCTAKNPVDRYESRAQQHCHDAHYLGTDATGAVHCWSIYHQTVILFEPDAEPALVAIPTYERTTDTAIENLGDYCAYVAERRGEWRELRVSESLVADAAAVIEA